MEDNKLPKIASNFNQTYLWLKQVKYEKSCVNHRDIKEGVTLYDNGNMKHIITYKFKEK